MLAQRLSTILSDYSPLLLEKRTVAFFIVAYLGTLVFLVRRASQRKAAKWMREPPLALPKIQLPYLGHMFGLLGRRMSYFSDIGKQQRDSISTISCLGTKIYVVGSHKFLPSVDRQPRTISSRYFFSHFVARMVGASKRSMSVFSAGLGQQSQGQSMLLNGVRVTKRILNSQTGTEMNHNAARIVNKNFNDMAQSTSGEPRDFWGWIRDEVLITASEATYGPEHPFRNPEVAEEFWKFVDSELKLTLITFFPIPTWLVKRLLPGYNAREVLVKAFTEYFDSGSHEKGSPVVNAHFPIFSSNVDMADVPRFECANAFASFANTSPTTFWTTYHVFSDPALLQQIRDEVTAISSTKIDEDGMIRHEIDFKKLKTGTILFSTIEEVTRYRATGIGLRMVLEDTTVGEGEDIYHLRAGGLLVIANEALHRDESFWGANASTFVANRFKGDDVPRMAYRAFGKGATACCGKNFALSKIASFMALLVMRYDIVPTEGTWKELGQDGRNTASQVVPPMEGLQVRILPRVDFEKVSWDFGNL